MDGEWEARPEKMRDETQTGRQAERGSTKKAVGPLGPHSPQSLIGRSSESRSASPSLGLV